MFFTKLSGWIAAILLVLGVLNLIFYGAVAAGVVEMIGGFPTNTGKLINYSIYSILIGVVFGVLTEISEKIQGLLVMQSNKEETP